MSGNKQQVRDLIGQEAADWFVANRTNLTAAERHDFATWLKTSPVHVEEYLLISGIARDLHAACENPDGSLESLLARARLEDDPPLESLWSRIVTGYQAVPIAAIADSRSRDGGACLSEFRFACIVEPHTRPARNGSRDKRAALRNTSRGATDLPPG
jgi:ferric-dicitrate binding protein FerR (iron transport regulator)